VDDGSYLTAEPAPQQEKLSRDDLTATISSLLSIGALSKVDAAISAQVGRIVKASPFDKPEAIAVLVLAGLEKGSGASGHTYTMASKEDALKSLAAVGEASGVEHISLDVTSLSGCGDICLETLLQESIVGLGLDANYTPGPGSLKGSLLVRADGEEAAFDLGQVADRLLAIEVGSTWRATLDAAAQRDTRQSGDTRPVLLERALVSAQAVKDAYGVDSPQYRAACCLLHKAIDFAVEQLRTAYKGGIVIVKASIDSSEMKSGAQDLVGLLNWSTQSHKPTRSLLQANASSDDSYLESFIAWVVMWGTFFLLLFFALSGCHCLKSMKFKQDSLLYGKSKAE
jgi:hypothetical protein